MGIEISVTEFKSKCLELLDKISRNEIDSIEVTKHGKPHALVTQTTRRKPKTRDEAMAELKAWQKSMKGTIEILDPDIDLTKPVFDAEDFDAYRGKVFPEND